MTVLVHCVWILHTASWDPILCNGWIENRNRPSCPNASADPDQSLDHIVTMDISLFVTGRKQIKVQARLRNRTRFMLKTACQLMANYRGISRIFKTSIMFVLPKAVERLTYDNWLNRVASLSFCLMQIKWRTRCHMTSFQFQVSYTAPMWWHRARNCHQKQTKCQTCLS